MMNLDVWWMCSHNRGGGSAKAESNSNPGVAKDQESGRSAREVLPHLDYTAGLVPRAEA